MKMTTPSIHPFINSRLKVTDMIAPSIRRKIVWE